MKSPIIRQKFLDFFAKNNHTVVASSSLIPAEDPTLLFTNAGMNQFKDLFLGNEKRSYTRACSIQKCVRAGGKHNDLTQVGYTKRHLTYFEMMGNFSFGDYFKKEAIAFAWDFLTKDMGLNPNKLYATVFETDDEAYNLWHEMIGLPHERISRLGAKDNFWQMGETGPCGPCTEILIDRGEEQSCGQPTCAPGCDCSRYLEIWNLVFMQFDRQANGELVPLTQTGVDTGMGFERLCMVMQDVDNVYQTDIFMHLIKKIEQVTDITYATSPQEVKVAFHVICDHIRSSSSIIADGGTPSNEGRGYVLRKIIRRAALFAQRISADRTLLPQVAQTFIDFFSPVYPELKTSQVLIKELLQNEIDRFSANLLSGQQIITRYIDENKAAGLTHITGLQAFKLYDTYGFPLELTLVIAQEQGLDVDTNGFDVAMQQQQEQSGKKATEQKTALHLPDGLSTSFKGYETLETKSKIIFLEKQDHAAWIVCETTPFYVESGGQVSDEGWVSINDFTYPVIELQKVGDPYNNPAVAIKIALKGEHGTLAVGDVAHCVVDAQKRIDAVRNHTATHLLQAALMHVLGKQVKQAGSVVHPDYLRFDFTHHAPMTQEQIKQVEDIVNEKIMEDIKTKIYQSDLASAKKAGVISFFGEKYNAENVRVVEVPGFSAELCGGTHASSTGIIGCFKITSETALSSGVRRLVAVTGPEAVRTFQESFNTVKTLAEQFKAKPSEVAHVVEKLEEQYQAALKEIKQLKKQAWKTMIPTWHEKMSSVGRVPFLYLELEDMSTDDMRAICQELERKTPGLYFLVSKTPQRASFLGYAAAGMQGLVDLNALSLMLKEHGLRGGGNKQMIQGGGTVPSNLKTLLEAWLEHAIA